MFDKVKYAFMSKEQKRIHYKMEMRKTVRELERWDRSLEKKKDELVKLGREANRQGIRDQYAVAFNGLKMVMNQQLRARKMALQMKMVESLRDLSVVSSDFMGMMGKVGNEVNKITAGTNFLKNQAAFETGMFSIEQMMDQMDGLMDDMDMNMETQAGNETMSDDAIAKLFDVPQAEEQVPGSQAEDSRIADLSKQLKDLLGDTKAGG